MFRYVLPKNPVRNSCASLGSSGSGGGVMEGRYRFEPVAVETTRINGKSSTMFLDKLGIGTWQLGQKGNTATGDRKEIH